MRRALLLAAGICAAVVVLAALGLFGRERGWWRFSRPERFPIWGLDVSHHQGPIAWQEVASEPRITFAYVKATEGSDWVDHRFRANWDAARRAGLRVGAYHFFNFCSPAVEQAWHFLSVVHPSPEGLPPAVDLEFAGNCRRDPDPAEVRRELGIWLSMVEQAWSRQPVIYATAHSYQEFLAGSELRYPIWIRGVWGEPRLPDGRLWTFWQFDNRARVHGISGFVDLNAFQGAPELFEQLAAQR